MDNLHDLEAYRRSTDLSRAVRAMEGRLRLRGVLPPSGVPLAATTSLGNGGYYDDDDAWHRYEGIGDAVEAKVVGP